ncbi:Kinesin-like protein NACK2 [Acorus gramineus]|uniref:Kinesin-like protein NACK2 n=1 Tax=Acorus gramineus TaxID=55184 RepID=A0AAV9AZN2_ACOGR|nr:Kinesin-like protein NACK2 [Acorus gramineus]
MDRIYVTVRARPLSSEEAKTNPWRISGNSISLSNQPGKFEFDWVFGEECTTVEVYEARTKEIVAAAVRGFNGTVFAYGQTNSGKTYTMRGSTDEPGVIPLAVHDLFNSIQEDVDREFLLRMSYMEIYNEEINDLLAPEHRKLQIHESLERGIFVAGLREEIVTCPEQVLDFIKFGESHRHIGETNMNTYSSRSHTIFRMIIESREKTEDGNETNACDAVRVSVLNLVDLAGSERAAKTGAEGVRLREGSHINKSLMTLGTVIKKLSEGAESHGSHVPYRDSKLTRILQPSLGGNANTAIICNITLAQILTDAALLRRQKKEIEELRAQLLGSHSEHLEEEILNLRNVLLQSELERERIALELQEEKIAQARSERRLKEQEKKIANLSSMFFYSQRGGRNNCSSKNKRRDTWCPGALSRKSIAEGNQEWMDSARETVNNDEDMGSPPLEELAHENEDFMGGIPKEICSEDQSDNTESVDDVSLPSAFNTLHITRRKARLKRLSTLEMSTKDRVAGCSAGNLVESECHGHKADASSFCQLTGSAFHGHKSLTSRESEAILVIKQLQDQIEVLEIEKAEIQRNLDNVVELATEQNASSRIKFEERSWTKLKMELHQELLNAREEAACEQLPLLPSFGISEGAEVDISIKLYSEVQEIALEAQNSRGIIDDFSPMMDDLTESFAVISKLFLFEVSGPDLGMALYLVSKLKIVLHEECCNRHRQLEELELDIQNKEKILKEQCIHNDFEKEQLLSHISSLQKELSSLSSCSLAKEKETLRRDLEKSKTKLKDTESKLKNAIQEKIKLESEKAHAEREVKFLHGQKILLERDIHRRESVADKRNGPFADRRWDSKASDISKGNNDHLVQAKAMELENTQCDLELLSKEYRKLEVRAFEMEAMAASLEEDLQASYAEREAAFVSNETLTYELGEMSEKLTCMNTELEQLQEEISSLKFKLGDSETSCQNLEASIDVLSKEKEEMALQLTDALLELEERNIWSAKEKASFESISEKEERANSEIAYLSNDLGKVRHELELCREECRVLTEKIANLEENVGHERKCSLDKSIEIGQLKDYVEQFKIESSRHVDSSKDRAEELMRRLSSMEIKMQNDAVINKKEFTRLRMRLQSTQAKLVAFQGRYMDRLHEQRVMDREYKKASAELREQLSAHAVEVIRLKKLLANSVSTSHRTC